MEALERIKYVDASYTWPHPTEEKKLICALFVRDKNNKSFFVYCPKISLKDFPHNTDGLERYVNNFSNLTLYSDRAKIIKEICEFCDEPNFYILPLGELSFREVHKEDIEKMLEAVR